MTMTTYDNAPPLDGWSQPVVKHCGLVCFEKSCPVCGDWIPANIELGSE